ncbi:TRAP transporter large permease [Pseudooceanicola sediminis]|uniref:TRAP transporter large permease protein n=1 Tax=Pseudooceanicola sediminis TaxID=2211117 RepID=A0A399J078_9RHOB|nr:TRAP transporter large permease [Pseudooceanicola sediminis]KAA2313954.1 TRAP transporter large permease [Puniceibacterium sp. HSS470]RII38765.1 TRAP transporter large permease [Pseudooceanicola sediminis]|tara:strand:+ start:82514 stop:83812 length:1299 start_codon:yes stop_codon:yes gene_type:complete
MELLANWPVGMAALFVLLLVGLPISIALTLIGLLGTVSIIGWSPALSLLGTTFFDQGKNYSLSVLPLFLLMGNFVVQSGIARELYEAAHAWLRHRKGGLALATVIACGGFSSVCGSSMATAATMARISLPSMRRYGYPDDLSTASIAAGGTLGILIPPSVILVFYGIMTQQDIGKLFLAGIVPGLLGILGYTTAVWISVRFRGIDLATEPKLPLRDRLRALKGTLGAIILFIFVMGGIYLGVFTPTESAGMGAAGALLLTILSGKFSVSSAFVTLFDAAKTTAMMFFILFGALTFTNYVNFSGMTADMQAFVTFFGDGPTSVILTILVIYLVLGCVLEGLSMIMLTVPIFYPVVAAQGFDLIWFGVFVVVITEISYITPPVGMNAFVLRSVVKDVQLSTIFRGLVPFVLMDIVRIVLLILVPGLVLFLPNSM